MSEQWQTIPETNGYYAVSSLGGAKRILTRHGRAVDRPLTPRSLQSGYLSYTFSVDGNLWQPMAHRVVASVFIGPAPSGIHQVNHLNGVKTDNRVSNLEWVTPSENMRHAFDTGLQVALTGQKNGNCRLSADDIEEIRTLGTESDLTQTQIADRFGITQGYVSQIITHRRR